MDAHEKMINDLSVHLTNSTWEKVKMIMTVCPDQATALSVASSALVSMLESVLDAGEEMAAKQGPEAVLMVQQLREGICDRVMKRVTGDILIDRKGSRVVESQ